VEVRELQAIQIGGCDFKKFLRVVQKDKKKQICRHLFYFYTHNKKKLLSSRRGISGSETSVRIQIKVFNCLVCHC
jgi:hypothetical protein